MTFTLQCSDVSEGHETTCLCTLYGTVSLTCEMDRMAAVVQTPVRDAAMASRHGHEHGQEHRTVASESGELPLELCSTVEHLPGGRRGGWGCQQSLFGPPLKNRGPRALVFRHGDADG